jgi:hypothetical protein
MKRVDWVWILGVTCVGCLGGGGGPGNPGTPAAQFPSKAALASVVARSAEPKAASSVVDADRWAMQPQAPSADYPRDTLWDQLLVDGAQGHADVRASASLRCAARELARFYVEHGGAPDDGIRRHILVRCGSTVVNTSWSQLTVTIPDNVPDAELERQLKSQVSDFVQKQLFNYPGETALGFARGHGRAAWVGYMGRPEVRFDGLSPLISGNSVTLQGTLLKPAAYAMSMVNQGAYGVARCVSDTTLALPAFRISCPVLEQDDHALVEIATRSEGQVLLNVVAQVELRRNETADLDYDAGSYGDNVAAPSTEAFGTTLLAGLNRVRAAAGVAQLTLEPRQSQTNGKLAPHLFLSSISHDAESENTIALGALAGWDVSGMIRDGGIFFGSVNGSRNPSRWLTYALESPLGRLVLLSPDMSRTGIGVTSLDPNGVGALITTYAFFGNQDHGADEVAVLQELARQRALRGLPAPRRARSEGSLLRALERVSKNEQNSMDALRTTIQDVVSSSGRPVRGYVMETTDLRSLKFDPSLLANGALNLQLGITHYRAPGGAWGQYCLFFVILDSQVREAKVARPRAQL